MTNQRSRAYKLQLSNDGIHLFLRCHGRLCRTVSDFLPYGATLYIAVALLDGGCPDEEIPAVYLDPDLAHYGGRIIRYVGTAPTLSSIVSGICDRMICVEPIHPSPQTWKIFLMALVYMEQADEQDILRCFRTNAAALGRPSDRSG